MPDLRTADELRDALNKEIHAHYDLQLAHGKLLQAVRAQLPMLLDALHALQNGRHAVVDEYVERAVAALNDAAGPVQVQHGERCIHPGLFATGRRSEFCGYCLSVIPMEEL